MLVILAFLINRRYTSGNSTYSSTLFVDNSFSNVSVYLSTASAVSSNLSYSNINVR